jgi:pre-mRNA-splicing factor CWC22
MAEPSGDRSPSPDVSDDSAGSLSSASEPLLSRSVSPEAEENPQSRPNKAQASPPVRSPSPRPTETSPHFSPTAEGELPIRRLNASVTPSPTPERIVMLKPPKATPDHRRGQRSPSPSPMSPRKRVGRGGAERLEEVPEDEELRKLRRYGGEDEEEDEDRNGRRRGGGDERRYERRRDEDDYRYRDRHRGRYDEERGGSRRGRREEGSDEERRDRRRDRGERRDDRDDRRDDRGGRDDRRGRMDDRENRRYDRRERGGEQENGKEGEQRREEQMEGANGRAAAVANGPARVNNPAITRTGGAYVPPFKLARMMQAVDDKSSKEYQRLTWDALRKSINGLINKVNIANIRNIVLELFSENLIRGRGLFARSLLKSQLASPTFTPVYAALLSVVNTKFPEIGELILKRVVLQFRRAFKRNDKPLCLAAVKMIAHLVNQQVAHEVIALELLTLLLEKPTEDSFEVAAGFVKEVGATLMDLSPQGLHGIFEALRRIAQEGEVGIRAQYIFEDLSAARRTKFEAYPAVAKDLDLVETEDQITHEVSLEDNLDPETGLGEGGS